MGCFFLVSKYPGLLFLKSLNTCVTGFLFFLVCMEDLRGYEILRKSLMKGEYSIDIASSIANNLAIVHRETHVEKLNREEFSAMEKEFQYVTAIKH